MSENKWLIGIVAVLLIALVGLVCVGLGAVFCISQPGSPCAGLLGGNTLVANPPSSSGSSATQAAPTRAPSTGSSAPAGNVLRLPGGSGAGGDPPTLDPANSGDAESAVYINEIFSGLVSFNKDLKIVPEIAQSWDVGSGGTVYTFHLRQDAKFHDGRPVTAQDFKYSFERAADPQTHSAVSPLYLSDIVGFMDKYNGKADSVSGVKVIDNYTLQITIDGAKSYFLAELTHPVSYVVDKNNVEGGSQPWYLKPNGTGPYELKSWDQGQRIVLVKNPEYYGEPKPSIDEVDYILGGGSPMTMYENGDLDATVVTVADIDRVSDPTNPLNKELTIVPELDTGFLIFNTQKPPFDDVNVRKAFAMSVDRQKLIDVVDKKMPVPATGILPQAFPGFNPDLKAIPYDPAQAKQLLAQSKYAGKLPDVTWTTVGSGGTSGPETQAIAQMLKDNLGVNISIEQTDWATYISQISGPNIQYQMFDIGWIADYVDPHDFLSVLFHSNSYNNWSGLKDPQVDKLLDQADVEQDQTKRFQLYQQAEQMIMAEVPVLPLSYGRVYWLTKPYVKGAFYPPLVIPRLKYMSISK
jgi:oligopeptide transport system substrate-binding protein